MRALVVIAAVLLITFGIGLSGLDSANVDTVPPMDHLPGCPPGGVAESVACFVAQLPGSGSMTYQAPSPEERAAWKTTVTALTQHCSPSVVPVPLQDLVQVVLLHDRQGQPVCILLEDAGRGWGLVALGVGPGPHHQVPHPLHDRGTPALAAALLDEGHGSSLVMAGTHRYAQLDGTSDMSHNDGAFQAAVEALSGGVHIQWHGMAEATCPDVDVYVTQGADQPLQADSAADRLAQALQEVHPAWRTATPGAPCQLHGSSAIQGPVVREGGGEWVHVEMAPGMRSAVDWVEPLALAW
jgi:hypothetical protein